MKKVFATTLLHVIFAMFTHAQITIATTNASGCDKADGKATVTVKTDAKGFDFEYSVNGGAYQASNMFEKLKPGQHKANVRDKNTRCIFSKNFDIGTPAMDVGSLTLINANNSKDIGQLKNGDIIDIATLAGVKLNVRANTSPGIVGSVVFELQGPYPHQQTENLLPYALFGDNMKGGYYGALLQPGDYTLTATPYCSAKGGGTRGTALTVNFKVIYTATVSNFTLWDADSDVKLSDLQNGDVINLALMPTRNLTIRAHMTPEQVGSVAFDLQGPQTRRHIENIFPYTLFVNDKDNYFPWRPPIKTGSYVLTATPFSEVRGGGSPGIVSSVIFHVVDQLPAVVTTQTNRKPPAGAPTVEGVILSALPNPFTAQTLVRFAVPTSGYASVGVFDTRGVKVARLYEGRVEGGREYQTTFESKGLPAGVYMLRLASGKEAASSKVVLIR